MTCRSFYIKKDGSLYVQIGHDCVTKEFQETIGSRVRVELPGPLDICGNHVATLKCGIILTDWVLDRPKNNLLTRAKKS